jgi:hypothetical protein
MTDFRKKNENKADMEKERQISALSKDLAKRKSINADLEKKIKE